MKPRVTSATLAIRASVEDGATRKTGSMPAAVTAASHGPASSGVRSGVMTPAPPAAAIASAKGTTP